MKRKKLFRIVIFLISFELLIIIGIKGYGIIRDIAIDAALSENQSKHLTFDKDKEETKDDSTTSPSKIQEAPNSDNPKTEFISVDSSYFDDALFIGDSRTVALRAFGSLSNAYYFAKTGISVNSLFEHPANDEVSGLSLRHILSERSYRKIYIMIGVNDLAFGTLTEFSDNYFKAVETIREYQPNAIIYVQSIVGITVGRELSSPSDFNNQTVINRNALLKSHCDGETLVYLDLFSAFRDDRGYLNSAYSSDGLHINPEYLYLWEDYLKANAIKIN